MNTNELIETTSDQDAPWTETVLLGEISAAKRFLAIRRADLDVLNRRKPRCGQTGDDPVEVYSDNTLLFLQQNNAVESVLRAEGMVACAVKRYHDWSDSQQEKANAEATRQRALKSETSTERAERERLEYEQTQIENAEKSAWDASA